MFELTQLGGSRNVNRVRGSGEILSTQERSPLVRSMIPSDSLRVINLGDVGAYCATQPVRTVPITPSSQTMISSASAIADNRLRASGWHFCRMAQSGRANWARWRPEVSLGGVEWHRGARVGCALRHLPPFPRQCLRTMTRHRISAAQRCSPVSL